MRKITKQSVAAFFAGVEFKGGNMKVATTEAGSIMYLHGHPIAVRENGSLVISDCGYQTNTTKERLNGVLQHIGAGGISQKAFVWYLNGNEMESNKYVKIF